MNQSEFLRESAIYTHFTLSDLMSRANRLREANMISRGARGLFAKNIEPNEAALILLAAMSGASANTCPAAVRKLSALTHEEDIDLSKFSPDTIITRETNGEVIDRIALKDYDPAGVDMIETISLDEALTKILDEPARADFVKSFTVDHVNDFAVITLNDGCEKIFGKKDDFNSGATTVISGRVLRILHCALLPHDAKWKDKAYFEWVKQVVKIGNEQGDEAAQKWMKENPFEE